MSGDGMPERPRPPAHRCHRPHPRLTLTRHRWREPNSCRREYREGLAAGLRAGGGRGDAGPPRPGGDQDMTGALMFLLALSVPPAPVLIQDATFLTAAELEMLDGQAVRV